MSSLRTGFAEKQRSPSPCKVITGRAARRIANKAAYAESRRLASKGYLPKPVNLFV